MSYKILSVGGSIVIPKEGFDVEFLKNFRNLILQETKKGSRFVLIIGGGATCRSYQAAARQFGALSDTEIDLLGIEATVLNARLMMNLFKGKVYPEVVGNPAKKITTNKPIIVASGWKPGCSTDKDAVVFAKTYGATEVFNLSNIDYVYDSDPKVNPDAKRLENITWPEFRKIIGSKWVPGANLPFDPMAAKEAEKLKLMVKFVKGTDLAEVENAISGNKYNGTLIK